MLPTAPSAEDPDRVSKSSHVGVQGRNRIPANLLSPVSVQAEFVCWRYEALRDSHQQETDPVAHVAALPKLSELGLGKIRNLLIGRGAVVRLARGRHLQPIPFLQPGCDHLSCACLQVLEQPVECPPVKVVVLPIAEIRDEVFANLACGVRSGIGIE